MSFVVRSLCFLLFCVTSAFSARSQITGKPGDNVTLQCQDLRAAVITVLEWIRPELKPDDYVFLYRDDRSYENYQNPLFRGRVELKDPEMKDGDMSVILKNVTINDTGTYECYVTIDNTEPFINTINLTVVEPGNNKDGGDKDGGDKDGGDKGGGDKDEGDKGGGEQRGRVGLVVSLSVFVLHFCFVALIFRKRKVII